MTKKQLQKNFPSIYNNEKIAEMAKKGFNRFWTAFKESIIPDEAKDKGDKMMESVKARFEMLYYTAFEDALNTFLVVCIEDTMHEVELCVNELRDVTAEIKEKKGL